MRLAARSAQKLHRFRIGLLASVAAAFLVAGCNGGNPGNANAAAAAEPKPLNVIEPVSQRSAFGNYLAGRFAERERDFARAAVSLNRALDEFPNDIALMRRTFYLMLEAGQMDGALRLAQRLQDAGGQVSPSELLLAAESTRKGDYSGAVKRLKAMGRQDLARYAVPLALAWAEAGRNDPEGGVAALAELGQESGFETLHKLHEAMIYELAGKAGKAEAAYRAALGDDPANAATRVIRAYGAFLERAGRASEARALYDKYQGADIDGLLFEDARNRLAEGRKPEPRIASAADGMAEGFFDIASLLPKERAGEIVLIYCRLALYLRPDYPLAELLLGDLYDTFGRYAEAVDIYRGIDKAGAYGWAAQLRLSQDLYEVGDAEGAVSLLRKMAAERQDRSDALIRLGNILRYEERFKESVAAYDEAVARIGQLKADDWTILYSRGIALEQSGEWDRAEKDLLKALELEPNQPYVLNYLGYSWVEQGKNLDRARNMLERAVAQRQDDGYIVDSMGWALYKLGEFSDAVTYLERAVALRPQDPVINDHLGDAYWRVGRQGEARIQWQRVLGLEPEDDLRKTVEQKLQEGLSAPKSGGGNG
jgi:tetratricopeptide (TPR) repeat protein